MSRREAAATRAWWACKYRKCTSAHHQMGPHRRAIDALETPHTAENRRWRLQQELRHNAPSHQRWAFGAAMRYVERVRKHPKTEGVRWHATGCRHNGEYASCREIRPPQVIATGVCSGRPITTCVPIIIGLSTLGKRSELGTQMRPRREPRGHPTTESVRCHATDRGHTGVYSSRDGILSPHAIAEDVCSGRPSTPRVRTCIGLSTPSKQSELGAQLRRLREPRGHSTTGGVRCHATGRGHTGVH